MKKHLFFTAFLITAVIFTGIIFSNLQMNKEREKVVLDKMEEVLQEYQDLQTIMLMSDIFGDEMTCLTFESQLSQMDKSLWSAGQKLDRYRELSEELTMDPFYIDQKIIFNRNEAMYYSMLKSMKKKCNNVNQTIILYFFKKKAECPDCDAQSFVLTDINKEIDPELSIFSFDANLDISSVQMLVNYYKVDDYPCIVVEDTKYCGLKDKEETIKSICENSPVSLCPPEEGE